MLRPLGAAAALLLAAFAPTGARAQTVSQAPDSARRPWLGVVARGGADFGGDLVGTAYFTDGTAQDIPAGQGIYGAVGGEFRPYATAPVSLRATLGYKFESATAENGSISFTRWPIELVGSLRLARGFHVGAGYVRHARIRFDGDEFAGDVSFDAANGATAEVGWRWAAITVTRIDYTDQFGRQYAASNVGMAFTGVWALHRRRGSAKSE